jgi:hypothetical protein
LFGVSSSFAQNASVLDSINYLRQESLLAENNFTKDSLNLQLIDNVKSLLRRKDFHKLDLGKLDKSLSVKKLRKPYFGFISWSLLYTGKDGTDSVKYHTHILLRERRYHRLYNVKSNGKETPLAMKSFDISNWYGAVYYDAIPYKVKRQWHFMFLGWRELEKHRQAKIIESVSLASEEIIFGEPKSLLKLVPRGRELIEYPKNVRLSLKYDPESEYIYYDDMLKVGASLSPSFSFNGYRFDKKERIWIRAEDIEINAKK